jgi:two-component SAPR family response regulator
MQQICQYFTDQTSYGIVMIDDDDYTLNYYKTVLTRLLNEHCCMKTFTEVNQEMFKFIKDHYIDLFIIDIHIGKQSGIDLADELLKTMTGVTILFVSGYNYTIDCFAKFDGKCIYDYISKPVDANELNTRVKALLNVSKSYAKVIQRLQYMVEECHERSIDSLRGQYFKQIANDKKMIEKLKGEMLKQ